MDIKEFIQNNDVDYTKNTVDETFCERVEKILDKKIGNQLKDYILKYGYLGFLSIEFKGITSIEKEESDMIVETQYLHKYFPKTIPFIVIGGDGEEGYSLIDSYDWIYIFDPENDEVTETHMKLYDYILYIFNGMISII